MISGLGLGNLGGLDTKSAPTPVREKKDSFAESFSAASNKKKETFLSNSSSAQENKTLKNNSEKKDTEHLDEKSASHSFKLDKSKKLDHDKDKVNPHSNSNVSEMSQMQMLYIPNQYNRQMAPKVDEVSVQAASLSGAPESGKLSAQAQPVAKFLKEMYENFGITPEKIINALNQLPANVLLQSPHEAMTPLFEKLGIQPNQFTKAEILFNEMISEIETNEKNNPMMTAMMANQMPLAANSKHDHSKKEMHYENKPLTSQSPTLDALIAQRWNRHALEPQNYRGKDASQRGGSQAVATNNLSEIFHVNPNQAALMQAQNPANQVAIDKLQAFDPNIQVQDVKLNPDKITDQFFVDGAQGDTVSKLQQLQLKNLAEKNKNQEKDHLKEELKNKLGDQSLILSQQDLKSDNQFANNINTKLDANLTANLTNVKANNMNQITDSVKTLMAKGGGEMKIQLHPEGLGDVQLKVKVQDGQVGIQMTTDNHDAKRLLENGLTDLKLNLAEHKLNLNHMKVDVKDQMNNNMMNMEHNMQREQARDFLGQFRDWNQSLRNSSMGHGSLAGYQRAPKAISEPTQQTKRVSSDGRLYLVA